jgi:hypothetical protein
MVLGLWLMVAPGVVGYGPAAADNGHIVGPIIVTFSTIALWEATRVLRTWNYPLAIWLLLAPWVLGYGETVAIVSDMVVGALVLFAASKRGSVSKRYGGGWSVLWKGEATQENESDD